VIRSVWGSRALGAGEVVAVVVAAVCMVASGLIHLHLWDIAYRHVATLGPLFLVQTIAAFVGAVVLGVTRSMIVMVGSVLLMVGTMVGFVLADTVGIFGFKLPEVTQWAYLALGTEAMASALLVIVLVRHAGSARSDGAANVVGSPSSAPLPGG
jgi:hypothetical protein